MSAHPVSSRRPVVVTPQPVRSVRVEWGISRRALGDQAPGERGALVTLSYETRPGGPERWALVDPSSGRRSEIDNAQTGPGTPSVVRSSGGCVHVHGGSLYAFVSIEDPQHPELLYARTDMFQKLGIAGGRYQPIGAQVELDSNAQ